MDLRNVTPHVTIVAYNLQNLYFAVNSNIARHVINFTFKFPNQREPLIREIAYVGYVKH